MSKLNPADWLVWDQNEVLPYDGGTSFKVRTVKPCTVETHEGFPVHHGAGEALVSISGKGELSFKGSSKIWIKPTSRVQERIEQSEIVFTSMDRPPPMSPEMLAISRMMRKNEIERERERAEMEKRYADRQRQFDLDAKSEKPSREVSSEISEAAQQEPAGSVIGTEGRKQDAGSKDVETDPVSGAED